MEDDLDPERLLQNFMVMILTAISPNNHAISVAIVAILVYFNIISDFLKSTISTTSFIFIGSHVLILKLK